MTDGDLWFVNALGISTPLRDLTRGFMVLDEITGVDMPDVVLTKQQLFNRDGAVLVAPPRFAERDVAVPFAVLGENIGQVRERVRALTRALTPAMEGFLYLRAPGQDAARALRCRVTAGLDGRVELLNDGAEAWMATVLNFHAFDPWWFDPVGTMAKFPFAPSDVPFFPMFDDPADVGPHFSSTAAFADVTVTNDGDLDARPFWTLTGPMDNPVLTNETTGEVMDFSANGGLSIPEEHFVQINTSDQYVTAVDDAGNSVLGKMTSVSHPFALIPGDNTLQAAADSVSAASSIIMAYASRWYSA